MVMQTSPARSPQNFLLFRRSFGSVFTSSQVVKTVKLLEPERLTSPLHFSTADVEPTCRRQNAISGLEASATDPANKKIAGCLDLGGRQFRR